MLKSFAPALGMALTLAAGGVFAQAKEVKIGVIWDMTGPFADAGSYAGYLGTKIAIDMINERGGVEGYKIKPVYVDAQSKANVAINEAERLLYQEKVDMITGMYSSAQCVPTVQKVEQAKKFLWLPMCTSTAIFQDKNLQYTFRTTAHSDQFGATSCDFLSSVAKSKLGKEIKDLKVAIIHEDGPFGTGVGTGNAKYCKEAGMQIVLQEGYSALTADMSALITKLKRAAPDVILHAGTNPDIMMFLRQSKSQNLKWSALIGHGAAYGVFDKLYSTFGDDAQYIFDSEPGGAQLLNPTSLAPGLPDLIKEMSRRYRAETKANELPPHLSMAFNGTWVLLTDVMPRAIKKYGGIDSEAMRKAALETDIPVGGTIQGYGVKFNPPGHPMAGQNARSSMPVVQYINKEAFIVHPRELKTKEPVMPLPAGHAYAK